MPEGTSGAFVEKVSTHPEEVEDELDPKRYLTTTKGERERPAEILLVGAKTTVLDTLGDVVDPEQETEATAEIFKDLQMEKSVRPIAPLLSGRWE